MTKLNIKSSEFSIIEREMKLKDKIEFVLIIFPRENFCSIFPEIEDKLNDQKHDLEQKLIEKSK